MRGEFTSFIHRIASSHRTFYKRIGVKRNSVRLACVKHAASVRPEPGSNSPINLLENLDRLNFTSLKRNCCYLKNNVCFVFRLKTKPAHLALINYLIYLHCLVFKEHLLADVVSSFILTQPIGCCQHVFEILFEESRLLPAVSVCR